MHGIIFAELRKYVETNFGETGWIRLLDTAGLSSRMYVPIYSYPDEELATLVATASAMTHMDAAVILEQFGEFLALGLLRMYGSLLNKEWRTLEVVENTETTIHRVVRMKHKDAAPPYLRAARTGSHQVTVTYDSPRRLCQVAVGIVLGMARHFGDNITIRQERCMHRGDSECLLIVEQE
ncbi:MAG TPA: heme NO-binding domain-containing protein [Thermoanaerobaculia bacterium]|nr:heme NO-binding domain-containing protein [Thermoanaerobaculia bacterium]